jgi:hypothetical protein
MKIHLWMMLTILWGGLVVAADEVPKPLPDAISTQKKSTPQIVIPVVPILDEGQVPEEDHPAPVPKPNRGPVPVSSLSEDTWYVIESPVPLIVLNSPAGHVGVQPEEGPVKVRGKFADGTGKTETRTFSSKHLYFVNAVKAGQIELLIVPIGVSAEAEVIRQPLTVIGLAPIPPPGPGPGPTPEPGPVPNDPPAPVSSFRVIFVKESGATLNAAQSSIPAAKVIRDYLVAKTTPENGQPGWREYDPDQATTNEQPTMQKLWEAVKPKVAKVPCLVIEVNGHATVMPFPASVDECMATLKKAGGE